MIPSILCINRWLNVTHLKFRDKITLKLTNNSYLKHDRPQLIYLLNGSLPCKSNLILNKQTVCWNYVELLGTNIKNTMKQKQVVVKSLRQLPGNYLECRLDFAVLCPAFLHLIGRNASWICSLSTVFVTQYTKDTAAR